MAAFESFESFECSVCMDSMLNKRPVALFCLHTFCTPCIKQLYKKQPLVCPTCRSETVVPDGDIDKLPVNRDLIKIMEKVEEINKNPENIRPAENLCQTCLKKGNRQQSVGMCFQCARKLCQKCIDQHKITAAFKDHQLITHVTNVQKPDRFCSKHNEDIRYICMECLDAVCVDCASEQQHADHLDKIIKFENGISYLRKRNGQLIDEFDQRIKEMGSIKKDISSDFAVLKKSKEDMNDLRVIFQKKLEDIENLMLYISENETALQNANTLICEKIEETLCHQNLLRITGKYSDLAFLRQTKLSSDFENETETRARTQNYTVPKVTIKEHVADEKFKTTPVATVSKLPPSNCSQVNRASGKPTSGRRLIYSSRMPEEYLRLVPRLYSKSEDTADEILPSGKWSGYFLDKRVSAAKGTLKTRFTVDMQFEQNGISFTGKGKDEIGSFEFKEGVIKRNKISYRKQYQGAHSIFYWGEYIQEDRTIEGHWGFQPGSSEGEFTMWPMSDG